ncbi:glutamate--cysteine ligase [Embleya sp. NPDC059237]|uniref:carboxylate-amine ligase n=1 Tax=Embleya sp. NPDC059237 TaxID=3346784 RepID=UPI0036CD6C62
MITLGVEEEYLLVDHDSGLPVPRSPAVRAAAGLQAALNDDEVQPELLQVQVEVATPVCETLDEIGGHLLRLRHAVAEAAEQCGCRLAAVGTAPFAPDEPVPVTDKERYRSLQVDAARLVDEALMNGMHVHVAIPDREAGVAVLNRIRPWLSVLLAMSANSPLWHGDDTGFASWRTLVFGRWPVTGTPPRFRDANDYDRRLDGLTRAGALADRGRVYWSARLSERFPTIEVRAMDVQLRADDAVMLAGLVRALVATALREEAQGRPELALAPELLDAAVWQAARHGLSGTLIAPDDGRPRPAPEVVAALLAHVGPELDRAGDTRRVNSLAGRLLREGTGAELQRRALAAAGRSGLTRMITAHTVGLAPDEPHA